MTADNTILKNEESIILKLREIYRKHGYSCFKMNKFEEYDLYSQNKEFLVSDSVITFTDTNGKLMALKPDVTLSIVKNYNDTSGVTRLCYNENVYRISEKTHSYREIMQSGLECIGEITEYNLCEVVNLAARSLAAINENCVLNISHLGILSALLARISPETEKSALISCISEKNPHGVRELCEKSRVSEETAELLVFMTQAYGEADSVIPSLLEMTDDPVILAALRQLKNVSGLLKSIFEVSARVDLSIVSDMNYYNGLVFQGYIEGIPSSVLKGGQYDSLMLKMGKKAKAVGFAVYLDLLERLKTNPPYDADVLLLYSENDDTGAVMRRVEELINQNKTVSAQISVPDKLTYKEIIRFTSDGRSPE